MAASSPLARKMRLAFMPLGWALRILALLPFPALYLLADIIAFMARDVIRYRRRVVRANIDASFPGLSPRERRRIFRRFYRHLADYFVETVKFSAMSPRELRERMRFSDTALVDSLLSSGRDIVIYTSHFGNWEWITSMGLWCATADSARFSHVYRPLRQPWFDRWFLRLRSRYNVSIPMHEVFRRLLTWRRDGVRWITGFLSDQKPSHAGAVYTVPFMERDTPFIAGTEELARRLDAAVLYFDTSVISRGRYSSVIRPLSLHPRDERPGDITRRYAAALEEQIRRTPEAYLWSHNRWRLPKRNKT